MKIVNEIWRNLAIIHALHSQSEQFVFRRRSDRIAALRSGLGPGGELRKGGRTGGPANSRRAAGGSLPDKFRRRFHALELAATRVAVRAGLLSQSPSYRCSFQGSP